MQKDNPVVGFSLFEGPRQSGSWRPKVVRAGEGEWGVCFMGMVLVLQGECPGWTLATAVQPRECLGYS